MEFVRLPEDAAASRGSDKTQGGVSGGSSNITKALSWMLITMSDIQLCLTG